MWILMCDSKNFAFHSWNNIHKTTDIFNLKQMDTN